MQNEITELRNQDQTLKRIVCLMCCLFASTMFAGCSSVSKQSVPDIIQAKQFQLVNSKGKVVGQFGIHNDSAIYHIFDQEGNTVMHFQEIGGTVVISGSFAMPTSVIKRGDWIQWNEGLEIPTTPPPRGPRRLPPPPPSN